MSTKLLSEKAYRNLQLTAFNERCSGFLPIPYFSGTPEEFKKELEATQQKFPYWFFEGLLQFYVDIYESSLANGIDINRGMPKNYEGVYRVSTQIGWDIHKTFDFFPFEGKKFEGLAEQGFTCVAKGLAKEGGTSYVIGAMQELPDGTCRSGVLKIAKLPEEIKKERAREYVSQHKDCFRKEVEVLRDIASRRVPTVLSTGMFGERDYVFLTGRDDWQTNEYSTLEDLLTYQSHYPPATIGRDAMSEEDSQRIIQETNRYFSTCYIARQIKSLQQWVERVGIEPPPALAKWSEAAPQVCSLHYPSESSLNYGYLVHVILEDIAQLMFQVHESGYIHRDLKPENFLLHFPNDDDMDLLLCDFQTAVKMNESGSYLSDSYGSEKYASPELLMNARGSRIPITRASDIFSFGLTLARVLNPTITRERLPSTARRLDAQHLSSDVDALAQTIKNPDYRAIFKKCCAYNPHDRYQDSSELYKELSRADFRSIDLNESNGDEHDCNTSTA